MQNIWITQESCISCGQCVAQCPHNCLSIDRQSMNSAGHHPAYLRNPRRCSGCEMCVRICPVHAIEGYK
ncbi:MAG: ferredoxin family protein [Brotaphodocola sp.]